MWTIAFLFILTVALTLFLRRRITPKYGADVSARFLERADYIPSRSMPLTFDSLRTWLEDAGNKSFKAGYVSPVLFPFDILFLLSLGLLLGFLSVALAAQLPPLSSIPIWVWWVLPALYVVADTAEDSVAAAILSDTIGLTPLSFLALSKLKATKLATVTLAIAQTAFLGALIVLLNVFPPPR